MSINATVDSVTYEGITNIIVGGKSIVLKEISSNESTENIQTVKHDATLSSYGGISFNVVTSGKAVYIGIPNVTPVGNTTGTRYPRMFFAVFDYDNGFYHTFIEGYGGAGTSAGSTSVSDGVATVLGASTCYMTSTDVEYAITEYIISV